MRLAAVIETETVALVIAIATMTRNADDTVMMRTRTDDAITGDLIVTALGRLLHLTDPLAGTAVSEITMMTVTADTAIPDRAEMIAIGTATRSVMSIA